MSSQHNNEYCDIGNNCMRFGCNLIHKNKKKKDCLEGDNCYDIRCKNLHSRTRNYKLFNKDFCYFGEKCNRRVSGECNRFHINIDRIPISTYLLIKRKEAKEKTKSKEKVKSKEKEKVKSNICNNLNVIESKYIPIDHFITLDFTYKDGNYSYF